MQWKELQALKVYQLENSLKKALEECSSLRKQYQQLKEDFQFNLAILDERDRELERCDAITAKALTMECNSSLAGEIQKQMEKYERTKWDMERRIEELEGKLILQRQEMTASFDSELRQRKHEFSLKIDEMHAVLLSHNLKVNLLSKKTEIYYQAYLRATQALKASEECCLQIQTQLHDRDQEISNLAAVKDRLRPGEDFLDLGRVHLNSTHRDDEPEQLDCGYEDLVQALKQCDVQMEAQHQSHTEELQKAEKQIVQLQNRIEVLAAQACCLQEDRQEAIEQQDQIIQRYKQQLSAGLKREMTLEQTRVKIELEWQRHCEDIKAKHYLANEQLIQDLTQARDMAKAELKEKELELHELTVLLHSVQAERDQAVQESSLKVDCLPSEDICLLQEQNTILRAVVTQMRKDMESLGHLDQLQASQHQGACATPTTQITGTRDQSTESSSKVSPAEKHANASALTEQDVKVAHRESVLTDTVEQNALVRQLQEENLYLRHQLTSGPVSGDMFDNVKDTKSNHPVMRTRLKQAASCIARLSREKQQLIEMANSLRAQITTARLHAESVEPEKDSSSKTQGDQHDQLSSVLGQLQYQLTTQELQFALSERVCTATKQLPPGTNKQGLSTNGAANTPPEGNKTTDRPENSTNTENAPLLRVSQNINMGLHSQSDLSRYQLSSDESIQSLKELWEILDLGLSSSIFNEAKGDELNRRDMAESDGAGIQTIVHGFSVPIHRRPSTETKQRMNSYKPPSNSTETNKPGTLGGISKIRNYNIKD
ncbi:coiled-coil domain-containing protein 57 isoform X2 [Anabas testudineus]|nr:coiled-coil domain-containing protein 57 isoform X2 [Anabas testudineus]